MTLLLSYSWSEESSSGCATPDVLHISTVHIDVKQNESPPIKYWQANNKRTIELMVTGNIVGIIWCWDRTALTPAPETFTSMMKGAVMILCFRQVNGISKDPWSSCMTTNPASSHPTPSTPLYSGKVIEVRKNRHFTLTIAAPQVSLTQKSHDGIQCECKSSADQVLTIKVFTYPCLYFKNTITKPLQRWCSYQQWNG